MMQTMETFPKARDAEYMSTKNEATELLGKVLNEPVLDKEVQELDPLNADDFLLTSLPQLNANGDAEAIVKQLDTLLLNPDEIKRLSITEARAALRDLGHLAASLRKHNADVNALPRLKENLLLLGNLIDEVPRDTVFSYGPRNPNGERQRRFTNLKEEGFFIESFKMGMKDLYEGTGSLLRAGQVGPQSLEWEKACEAAMATFEHMATAIRGIRKSLPPEIFTHYLRPYFEPIILNDKIYFAPGGAQMPVLLFDQLIWGSDSGDATYTAYKLDNISYSPASVRNFFHSLDGSKSLVTLMLDARENSGATPQDSNAKALLNLLNSIVRFRTPHRKVANDNFALRSEAAIGSGGYPPKILDVLIEQTMAAREKVANLVASNKPVA